MESAPLPVAGKFSSHKARRSHTMRLPQLEARKLDSTRVPLERHEASRKGTQCRRLEHHRLCGKGNQLRTMRRIHISAQAEDSDKVVRDNARILHIRPGEEEKARGEERAEVAKQ